MMNVFFDENGKEYAIESCNGVEEKTNIANDEVVGYVATLDSDPICDISEEVYKKLKKIYRV